MSACQWPRQDYKQGIRVKRGVGKRHETSKTEEEEARTLQKKEIKKPTDRKLEEKGKN
jgi:hypothetical protein